MLPDDDDDYGYEEPRETDPVMRELRSEMVRLQAQIDQLAASARERASEIADLRVRMAELEERVDLLRMRHRRNIQMWGWIALMYGATIGLGLSYIMRP